VGWADRGGVMTARLPILVRRSRVFDLVVSGKSYEQIKSELYVSEDTITRDMAAIGDEVSALCRDKLSQVLAVALAHLEAARDAAWREYQADIEREEAWFAGKLDYATSTEEISQTDKGLYSSVKTGAARPSWRSNRAKWLDIVVITTREICALVGVKRLLGEEEGELVVRVEYAE
jgi:hypothetical protein